MAKDKNLVNKKQSMKKAAVISLLLITFLGAASAQFNTTIDNIIPEDGEEFQRSDYPATIEADVNITSNETAEVYSVLFKGTYSNIEYNESRDTWTYGQNWAFDLEDKYNQIGTIPSEGWLYIDFPLVFDTSGPKTLVTVVDRYNRDPVYTVINFRVTQIPTDVSGTDRIVDGGIIDQTLTTISDSLGIGIKNTRMFSAFFLSLAVGLAIGWTESYGSTGIAYIGFLLTFVSMILIGLAPALEGLLFTVLLIMSGWLYARSTSGVVQ
jgi:hypothetical protein